MFASLADHKQLRQNWQEYQAETGSEIDYQDYLELLLLHRTALLKQAEYDLGTIAGKAKALVKETTDPLCHALATGIYTIAKKNEAQS